MNVDLFDYELPTRLIAQEPLVPRDTSRLMVVHRSSAELDHRRFSDLPVLLRPGDLLVVNDTRVLPARLLGRKESGGRVEVLLLERAGGSARRPLWSCLLQASRPPAKGARIRLGEGLRAEVIERSPDGWLLALTRESGEPSAAIERLGRMPLPPYIRRAEDDPRSPADRETYQTVFASVPGAVAAPTAGLHFTPRLLGSLAATGIRVERLTLHVGPGTFLPVRGERVEDHRMHDEAFVLPGGTAEAIEQTREAGGRVVAVGTTVARTLEHRARPDGTVKPGEGRCDLFIVPGFRFRVVDLLLTNFHLPRSTLLMLVSAFAGRDLVLAAYAEAVRREYRFYSYGDAMMVV